MALQHKLSVAGPGIPELHTSVLRTGHDPVSVGGESNGQNEILLGSQVSTSPVNVIFEKTKVLG